MSFLCLFVLTGCVRYAPAAERTITEIPPIASAPGPWADRLVYVEAPMGGGEIRTSVERALLHAGYRLTQNASDGEVVVLLGNGGGAYAEHGRLGQLSSRGFDVVQWAVSATVTYRGRLVYETTERASFATKRHPNEPVADYTQRVSSQQLALANLISAQLANDITGSLASAPDPGVPGVASPCPG